VSAPLAAASAGCGGAPQDDAGAGDGGAPGLMPQVDAGRTTAAPRGGTDSLPKKTDAMPMNTFAAAHPALPQIVSGGGKVLRAAEIVGVTFAGEELADAIADFDTRVVTTPMWAALAEYGVGPATVRPLVQLTEAAAATVDDADIRMWLATRLSSASPLGAPNPNAIYTLYYPTGTTVTRDGAPVDGAYHGSLRVGGVDVVFAVVPRHVEFDGLHGMDVVSLEASHELAEAATDPLDSPNGAFAIVDTLDGAWNIAAGSEVADLCSAFPTFYKPDGFPYTLARTWSNAAAARGEQPCVPAAASVPFFGAAPVLSMITLGAGSSQTLTLRGVKIPVGDQMTIEVDLFSTAPTDPFRVVALDLGKVLGKIDAPLLDFTFDHATGNNGDKLKMTISALSDGSGSAMGKTDAEPFVIVAALGKQLEPWYGVVAF
jgi:hypothetical protein